MPAPSRLMNPARSISLWLMTSASAGASLRVETKNWEAFMGMRGRTPKKNAEENSIQQGLRESHGVDSRHAGAIMNSTKEFEVDYARPRRVQTQRRHHPAQYEEPGFLGQTDPDPLLAVPARGHQIR